MKRSVTVQELVCDMCMSVIGPNNASSNGLVQSLCLKVMQKLVSVRLIVVRVCDDAEDEPLDLCEHCLREVVKSAGVM